MANKNKRLDAILFAALTAVIDTIYSVSTIGYDRIDILARSPLKTDEIERLQDVVIATRPKFTAKMELHKMADGTEKITLWSPMITFYKPTKW